MSQRALFSVNYCTCSELKQCTLSTVYSVTDLTGEVYMPGRVNKVDQVVFRICMEEKVYIFTGCLHAWVGCYSLAC